MLDAGGTVDVLRMASRCRYPAIEGLAELPDHNEIVDCPVPQRAKQIRPALRQRLLPATKQSATKLSHASGGANFRVGKLPSCTEQIKLRGSPDINATIGHWILKIHLDF